MSEKLLAVIIQLPAEQAAEVERRASLAGMTVEHFISLVIGAGLALTGEQSAERSKR